MKKKYRVVIHMEGALDYTVEAEDEEEAEELANDLADSATPEQIMNMLMFSDADIWEEK